MRSMRHRTVYVSRVPKYVVTKETNMFAAMCKVTCLQIMACELILGVCYINQIIALLTCLVPPDRQH